MILGKGGTAESSSLMGEQCLLAAHPFEHPVPWWQGQPQTLGLVVSSPDFTPSRSVLRGMFKTALPALWNWCKVNLKGELRQGYLVTSGDQEVLLKHSISADKCCF